MLPTKRVSLTLNQTRTNRREFDNQTLVERKKRAQKLCVGGLICKKKNKKKHTFSPNAPLKLKQSTDLITNILNFQGWKKLSTGGQSTGFQPPGKSGS